MIKSCVATILLFMAGIASAEQSVAPDVRTPVKVSNRDVNRFVCHGTMQDMIYSKEKEIAGHFARQDAFVKFKIKKVGSTLEYATRENELYLVCDGNVYNIITQPTDMPSVTVRLNPPAGGSFKENMAIFRDMPLEKQALHVIQEAYDDTYPSSYKITALGEDDKGVIAIKPGFVEATLRQYVDVEGVGLRLKTYAVTSLASSTITINEKDFLRADISDALLAVAVVDHNLQPQQKTKVFVVEKRGARDEGF